MPRLALALLALTAASTTAFAQRSQEPHVPRVSVGPFSGQRTEFARSVVGSAISEHVGEVEFIAPNEYSANATRLGFSGTSSDEAISQVGQSLRLDGVVVGSLEHRGDTWRLQLRVLRGRDAHVEGTVTWEMNRVDELSALRADVWEQIAPYLHIAPQRPASNSVSNAAAGSTNAEIDNNAGASGVSGASGEREALDVQATPGLPWLSVRAGGGLAGRSWRVPVLGEATPRGYENPAFGEMSLGLGALYRWGQQRYGLGGDVQIAFPLGLTSQGRDASGRLVALATSAFELSIAAVFARRPSFGGLFSLQLGVLVHSFSLDTERLAPEMRLARMGYVGFRVAGEGLVPLFATQGWELGAVFGGELRAVGVGAEARQAFGMQPSGTIGLGSWFGVYTRLDQVAPGLGLRLTAEFVRYRTTFAGSATIGTVSDSVDDYNRFALALSYSIGASRSQRPSTPTGTR